MSALRSTCRELTQRLCRRAPRQLYALAAAILWALLGATVASAGGGPENLLLVVNQDSYESKTVANQYIHDRQIPPNNVVYLTEVPAGETATVVDFRRHILTPILEQIEARRLARQIDYIVYSDGFPTRINIWWDTLRHKEKNFPSHFKPVASINALTYFADQVRKNEAEYYRLDANRYMRGLQRQTRVNPFVGPLADEFQNAAELYEHGKFDAALATLSQLARQQPDQALVHLLRATALARLDRRNAALTALETSVGCGWSDRSVIEAEASFKSLRDAPRYVALLDRLPDASVPLMGTTAFDRSSCWATNGLRNSTPDQGERYYLSTVLAVTRERGLPLDEYLAYLRRAAAADGSTPQGTFYFTETSDVRTKTRAGQIAVAKQALADLGYETEVVKTWAPMNKDDIVGLSFGVAAYDWSKTGSTIRPGAICECLTSGGGVIGKAPQTPLTELLRAGAAGSSGAVIEPFAIHQKFPNLMIHAHYVRGASLAEAFYQSVYSPYQLLIVGDPLCQPWAQPVDFEIRGITAGDRLDDARTLEFDVIDGKPSDVRQYRVYLDGALRDAVAPGTPYRLSGTGLADGYHELGVTAISRTQVASQSRRRIGFHVGESASTPRLVQAKSSNPLSVKLRSSAPRFSALNVRRSPIVVYHDSRRVGVLDSASDVLELSADQLGSGPVRLRAQTTAHGETAWSKPLVVSLPLDSRR